MPFRCSSIPYVIHQRTCFISHRFIFLHRRQAKSYSCDDGRLLSLNSVALCNSLWPKQTCLSHAFWKTAGFSSAPGAMSMHEKQIRRLTLHWVPVCSWDYGSLLFHSQGRHQTMLTALCQWLREVQGIWGLSLLITGMWGCCAHL